MSLAEPRKYQHIWEALKEVDPSNPGSTTKLVSLELPRESHKTVLNALRKESLRDRTYRFKCIEEGTSFEIGYTQIGDLLQVYLRWKNHITSAFVITPERIAKMRKWK